jgi:hypothetical protein
LGRLEHTFSTNDAVCTPRSLLDTIEHNLGRVGLDPFSHPASEVRADSAILLPQYAPDVPESTRQVVYGDAAEFVWSGHGLVFANGPYSTCAWWVERLLDPIEGGDEALALVPVRTGSKWWQNGLARFDAICFLRGRLTFNGQPHPAPFHSALAYRGPRAGVFRAAFSSLGWTVGGAR